MTAVVAAFVCLFPQQPLEATAHALAYFGCDLGSSSVVNPCMRIICACAALHQPTDRGAPAVSSGPCWACASIGRDSHGWAMCVVHAYAALLLARPSWPLHGSSLHVQSKLLTCLHACRLSCPLQLGS